MSEFYANSSFLERKHFFTKYYLLIKDISFGDSDVESVMNKLKNYNGFGIEEQIANLKKCSTQLRDYKEDVRTEFYSLVKIVDTINDYENRANGILGESNSKSDDFILAEPEKMTKSLTHSDIYKLLKQLKYYTQVSESAKKLYDMFYKLYDLNRTVELPDDLYYELKRLFSSATKYGFVYSNVEYFTTDYTGDVNFIDIKDSGKFSTETSETKNKFKINTVNAEGKVSASGLKLTQACMVDGNYVINEITVANASLKGDIDLGSIDITNIIKKLKKGKDAEKIFDAVGIKISASVSCIKTSSKTILKINDDMSYYDEIVCTIGEASAELEFGASGVKAKAGASAANIESKQGIITNDARYTINGKVNAGVEVGVESSSNSAEGSFGMFSLGAESGDGFDYYVWQ